MLVGSVLDRSCSSQMFERLFRAIPNLVLPDHFKIAITLLVKLIKLYIYEIRLLNHAYDQIKEKDGVCVYIY